MFWKTVILAIFVVGVLAEYQVSDSQKQQLRNFLKDTCKENGAEDKVGELEATVTGFQDCLKNLFDFNTIKKEIEDAKPNGALDEVFKKYCAKSPQLKTCIHNLLDGASVCMDSTARDHISQANNGTDQLIDFVCHKDGDRIALFIAEGGPECFQEKVPEIRTCGTNVQRELGTVEAVKKLSLGDKCKKFDEVTHCIVHALEGCSTPTPANMAESLFKYLRKGSPCNAQASW